MTYEIQDEEYGAYYAFETGYGDCTEHSDLFTTLCRINGIEARTVSGFTVPITNIAHLWNEVYIEGKGWIPFDSVDHRMDKPGLPGKMINQYIYISFNEYESPVNYESSNNLKLSFYINTEFIK